MRVAHVPGAKSPVKTKLCTVAPFICGTPIILLNITILTHRILRWYLVFLKKKQYV